MPYQKKPRLNHWPSCTEHTKQSKQRNENFKWAILIFSHSHLHLVRCKAKKNGTYQFTKDICLHKPQNLKKCILLDFQPTQLLGFLVWVVYLFISFQVSIKSKFSNVASTSCRVTQQLIEFSLLGESMDFPKICSFSHLEKSPPVDSTPTLLTTTTTTTTTRFLFSAFTKG